ncbi:MAG: FG-GAP-like repeat-containing protein [candidate division WOR-3 bacterium]|nr:FG-GAP-like repeat-containing protein [candidate division WOR-3 bacterium]
MNRRLTLLLAALASVLIATNMRRVAQVPSGPQAGAYGKVVCCDSDHDSLPEMIFYTGTIHSSDPSRHEVWEHQGWNRFGLVYADTGAYPEPVGITTGNAIPFAAGDIDGDGLTDIVCINIEIPPVPDTFYCIVMTLESPDSFSYPCSLSWYYRYSDNGAIPIPTYYPPDLDEDGHKEIFCATPSMGACIWENTGNNQNELVWRDTTHAGYRLTYGDFDMDGRMNFASASLGSYGTMSVWECTGDDQYEVVYQDTVRQPNGADLFTTNDIDGDGKPEFYVAYENVPRGKMYLYMWEADQVGTDEYHRTLVDSVGFSGTDWGRISECGDIDGDGIDECIWTTPDRINVYKAFGDNDLREVWHWNNDHGGFRSLVSTVYDVNSDGYNELITAGNAKISIFEVDAVDLLSPNGGACSVGDTVSIRWVTNMPPRCDSVSLFLRRDSLWRLDTIATGLPGTDTIYRWVVPANVPDTGRIVVIAYGPGWQYDMSDSAIHFAGGGVAEGPTRTPLQWALSVSPNPARGAVSVSYSVPRLAQVRVSLFDPCGRVVKELAHGEAVSGLYVVRLGGTEDIAEGVYYVTLRELGPGRGSWTKKLVIQR